MKKLGFLLIIYFALFGFINHTYARGDHPDTYNIKVSPNFFGTFEETDFSVSAIKNNLKMPTYEGYITITIFDERGYILKPSEASLPNDGWIEFTQQDQGEKKFKSGLMIRKGGNYKICASDFSNENRSGCNSILVYDKSTNQGLMTLLNKRGITVHENWDAFKPNNSIRRDEASKMIITAIPYVKNGTKLEGNNKNCKFDDIGDAWSDLQWSVRESCKLGIFKGSNGKFNPKDTITNGQLITVIGRILYGKLDESGESYVTPYANRLKSDGLLSNVKISKSEWNYPAKRGTVAKLLGEIM